MAGHAESLFVEIEIRAPVDQVWERTQTPDLHQRWDLRFSEINYLPRPDPQLPQRFLYSTRIGFGARVSGEGESVGTRGAPGEQRVSALRFWSEDPKSLIREGSGYWKYISCDAGATRFLTRYDYEVRFGAIGRLVDRWGFRPLLGWATAWSFDRLRLWIEKGIDPAISMRRWLIYLAARLTLALVFVYQGLVPKLALRHPEELAMIRSVGLGDSASRTICIGIGIAEVLLGLLLILAWSASWPIWIILAGMPVTALAVGFSTPARLVAPFNPIALNLSVFALAAVTLLGGRDLPRAACCMRRPTRGDA